MTRFGHPSRKTLALVVAGIAGSGLLATGVASAATSVSPGPASSSTADITTASLNGDGSTVGPKLKVRERGARKQLAAGASPTSATVTNGETVIVVGLKTDTTSTARLVVVLPHAGAAKPGKTPKTTSPTSLQS